MKEKYDRDYENKIILMAENKIKTGRFKVFDYQARAISRVRFPELLAGQTQDESCLIIANREGETIVITQEFERVLFNALKNRF